MELKRAALMLIDVGNQFQLPIFREADLVHAENNLAQLLEAILDAVQPPLMLSKLEGSGAFLYAVGDSDLATTHAVMDQLPVLFNAFHTSLQTLIKNRQCHCRACLNLHVLRLKVVLHFGEAVFKQVRQFSELAGETVILLHRLNQSTSTSPANIIMSESFYQLSGGLAGHTAVQQTETAKGLGQVTVWVYEFT